jgi:molecular chaperone GrpE
MSQQDPIHAEDIPLEPDPDAPKSGKAPASAEAEIENLRAEKASLFERLARAQADFQNTRKRLENDFEQRLQYANSELLKSLLPVIDNFERALAVEAGPETGAMRDGLKLVHDQLLEILRKHNLQQVDPEPGTAFDPNLHEALMQKPDDRHADGPVVLEVFQKGYTLHGRRLRPAQVVVSRKP